MSEKRQQSEKVGLWNIANILTTARIILVPFFVWFWLIDGGKSIGWRIAATAVFLVAAYTDQLDGRLARSRGLVTDFGKIADPIADKALTGAALIVLSAHGSLWWWVTILILVREWGITLMRLLIVKEVVIAASKGGKLKTVTQIASITLLCFPFAALHAAWVWRLGDALMAFALGLTLVTGADYVDKAVRALRGSGIAPKK